MTDTPKYPHDLELDTLEWITESVMRWQQPLRAHLLELGAEERETHIALVLSDEDDPTVTWELRHYPNEAPARRWKLWNEGDRHPRIISAEDAKQIVRNAAQSALAIMRAA